MADLAPGLIGPNAILQYLPVLERLGGSERVSEILAHAGLYGLPDGSEMIDEGDALRLHRQVRLEEPVLAPSLAAEAGRRTADYILANRIPTGAQRVLTLLPAPLAAPLLARAIARHAWTFAGSGRFATDGAWRFEIGGNPLARNERSEHPACHWHAAVFERLYRVLVAPDCRCRETACCAQPGVTACRFEVARGR
jgi:divinyl protochlorophyllide a 8-vinyl-reductase